VSQRTAIVTGGASGIGAAISRRLAADGAAVAVWDLDGDAAEKLAAEITADGGRAIGQRVDVTDRPAIDAGVDGVAAELGAPAILVTSAGLSSFTPFLEIDVALWNRQLEVNLTGTFHCCQAVIPHMLEQEWGRIVTISSSSTYSGVPQMTHYVAAKSGVNGLTKSLALEFAPHGITVNTIPPSSVDTPMMRWAERTGGVDYERSRAATPVGRIGRPEDIAAAAAFLVRDEASYVTGQIIGVNGGRHT
jgi:NAD(P)-dependent dehydrogenase (short-subunit alcohol dehydrogenase family)